MAQTDADELLLLSLRRAQVPSVPASLAGITPDALLGLLSSLLPMVASAQSSGAGTVGAIGSRLPAQIAARHKVATGVSSSVRDLGFQGDWGANSLLYPNEREVRRLISWLASKLPKASSEVTQESGGLASSVRTALAAWSASTSLPAPPAPAPSTAGGTSVMDAIERALAGGLVELTGQEAGFGGGAGAGPRADRAREAAAAIVGALQAGAAEAAAAPLVAAHLPGHGVAAAAVGAAEPEAAGAGAAAGVPPLTAAVEALRGRGGGSKPLCNEPPPGASPHQEKQHVLRRAAFAGTVLGALPSAFARTAAFAVAAASSGINPLLDGAGASAVAAGASGGAKTEEEVQAERELELSRLQSDVDAADAAIKELSSAHASLLAALPALRQQLQRAQEDLAEMERGYLARRACLDMLPEAPEHLARLAAAIDEHTAALLALSEQWDGVRLPLLAAIHDRLVEVDKQEAAFVARSAATRTLQSDMAALISDGRAKQQQLRALQAEWEAVQAGIAADAAADAGSSSAAAASVAAEGSGALAAVSRSAYTRRVMDVVRSIRKQKAEIGKIVRDVRNVQQDINGISERLGRTSKSAMQAFERAATEQQGKGDMTGLQVLRQAVNLQEAFQRLIAVNGSIGQMENEIRDLEGRIDSMAQRNDARNMSALRGDLAAFAAENQRIEERLQQLGVPVPPPQSV